MSAGDAPIRSTEPHDRLTRLCAVMTAALDVHPEYRPGTDECIVFFQDGERGGLQLHGYEDDTEAMVDLFLHLRAIFKANGKDLILAGLGAKQGVG